MKTPSVIHVLPGSISSAARGKVLFWSRCKKTIPNTILNMIRSKQDTKPRKMLK